MMAELGLENMNLSLALEKAICGETRDPNIPQGGPLVFASAVRISR